MTGRARSWLLGVLLFGALAGCDEELPDAPAATVWAERPAVASGEEIRIHTPAGTEAPTGQNPAGEALSFEVAATDEVGRITWSAKGPDGSYIIEAGGSTFYVDIGVRGPGGEMADLQTPPPPPPPIWPVVLAGVVGVAAIAAATVLAWRRFRPLPPPPPAEPPELLARRAWARTRGRDDLLPDEMAVELSAIYRRYLDATHPWQASSRTTREILDNLADELVATELERAARLLRAMDLIKFAGREAHTELFVQFDQDFDALVRPRFAPGAPK